MVNEIYTFWIAIYGAIVGTGSLFYYIITYYLQNTPRLKVEIDKAKLFVPGPYSKNQNLILVNVANIGRKPVTLSNFGFAFKKVEDSYTLVFASPDLPKKLEEGDTHSIQIDRDYLKKELSKQPKEKQMPEYAWVKDHTGKKHKSKEISKIRHVYNDLKLE